MSFLTSCSFLNNSSFLNSGGFMNNTCFPIPEGSSWLFFHLPPVGEDTDPKVDIDRDEDDQEDDTKPSVAQDTDRDDP